MDNAYLSALALLKLAFDERGATYVDYLLPFVGDTIRTLDAASIDGAELRAALLDRYGLEVPSPVLNTLTRRLARNGHGTRSHGCFLPNRESIESAFNFDDRRSESISSIDRLAESFVHYARDELGRTISLGEATAALTAYADRNGLPILNRALERAALTTSLSLDELEYVVSRFVIHAFEHVSSDRDTLVMLAKGSKLASAIYLPDPGDVARKISNLIAVFDTPFMLSALGYQGPDAERAARDALELAYETGIDLRIFEDTLAEISAVLEAVGTSLRTRGSGSRTNGVGAHFAALGYSASDVQMLIGRLPGDIASLRVRVIPRPPIPIDLSINETLFEERLQAEVRYTRHDALVHDLDAVAATYRLRRGALPATFETARALFVTPNSALTRATRSFFSEEYGAHWPVAIADDDFATILWLKHPLAAPDLPAHQVLADAYAALEPNVLSWTTYVEEIDRLRADDSITEDDYLFLKYSPSAKAALMEETLGAAERVTGATIEGVRGRLANELAAPIIEAAEASAARYEAQLEASAAEKAASEQTSSDLTLRLAGAEEEIRAIKQAAATTAARAAQAEQRFEAQRAAARHRAERTARWVRLLASGALILLLTAGAWFSAPTSWELPPATDAGALRWLSRGSVGVLLLGGLASLVSGWDVKSFVRTLEVSLSKKLEARYLRMGNVPQRSE